MARKDSSAAKEAGRARNTETRTAIEVARREARKDVTPLEILLEISRHNFREWQADPTDKDAARFAVTVADKAAPFIHPKRASIQQDHNHKGQVSVQIVGEQYAGLMKESK